MKIAIRADSSARLGSGHLIRCLALAHFLRAQGAEVVFLSRLLPGTIAESVLHAGMRLLELPPLKPTSAHHGDLDLGSLGMPWQDDWQQCVTGLRTEGKVDWIAVDHYGIGSAWEAAARESGASILVVDDLADRTHDCDVVVNPNPIDEVRQQNYERLLPRDCIRLLGTRYALLREEFARIRADMRQRDGTVRRMLICFGGSDNSNETAKAVDVLAPVARAGTPIDVVIGHSNVHRGDLERRCSEIPNVVLHVQTNRMAQLVGGADLGVGAGGGAALERCCLGLPTIFLSIADNQIPGSRELARRGAGIYLGNADHVDREQLRSALKTVQNNPELLQHISACAYAQVDGRGAHRVARTMLAPHVELRLAGSADKNDVYQWRNAEETRRGALDQAPIAFPDHERWFASTLTNPNRPLLIGESAGQPIGVLRYDIDGTCSTVSVYLVPAKMGQGLGPALLREGHRWLRKHRPDVIEIHAFIRTENVRSHSAFFEAGYGAHGTLLRKVIGNEP